MSRATGFHATGGKTDVATSGAPRGRSTAYAAGGSSTNESVSLEFGLPMIRALRACPAGDDDTTVEVLVRLMKRLEAEGGSNAQRDVFIQTLGIAAYRAGAVDVAKAVRAESGRGLRLGRRGLGRQWADWRHFQASLAGAFFETLCVGAQRGVTQERRG